MNNLSQEFVKYRHKFEGERLIVASLNLNKLVENPVGKLNNTLKNSSKCPVTFV